MMVRKVTWAQLKQIVDAKNLSIQAFIDDTHYELYAVDGAFTITCLLNQADTNEAASVQDFIDNYQGNANKIAGTTIRGQNGLYQADVIFEDGLYKLATDKKVQVESLAGVQENASNYLWWEEVATGDTLRIVIPLTDASPIYDETFTVQAGEDRFTFATRIELEMNQDFVNFQPWFKATKVDDNSIIFLEAKNIGEAGENITLASFNVYGTGTIAATLNKGFDNWQRRTSTIQASKSTKDPRLGVFGVEGTVETRTADVSGLYEVQPYTNDDPAQYRMDINPGGTPAVFTFPMDPINDIFVSEIRFFGLDSGIQFTNFLGRNSALTNGIYLEIKSDNNVITLPLLKTTEDFADKFAFGGGDNFQLYIQSGADKFLASFLTAPFPLRRSGTFGVGNDDYIKIFIQDNLSQVTQLESAVVGVVREA